MGARSWRAVGRLPWMWEVRPRARPEHAQGSCTQALCSLAWTGGGGEHMLSLAAPRLPSKQAGHPASPQPCLNAPLLGCPLQDAVLPCPAPALPLLGQLGSGASQGRLPSLLRVRAPAWGHQRLPSLLCPHLEEAPGRPGARTASRGCGWRLQPGSQSSSAGEGGPGPNLSPRGLWVPGAGTGDSRGTRRGAQAGLPCWRPGPLSCVALGASVPARLGEGWEQAMLTQLSLV